MVLVGSALAISSLGLPWGGYPGTDSVARFFIVAAVALALIGGLHLGRAGVLRWAAYAGAAGTALYVVDGLTGGAATLLGATGCFWLAARRTPEGVSPSAC
jgi:hypothetical protein